MSIPRTVLLTQIKGLKIRLEASQTIASTNRSVNISLCEQLETLKKENHELRMLQKGNNSLEQRT